MTAADGEYATEDSRWLAVAERDAKADGLFVFSVRTTGVYCRPSCPARLPNRQNVSFHPDGDSARSAGFRACKRCLPDGLSHREMRSLAVEAACRLIESSQEPPTLSVLSKSVGLSQHYFHRTFTQMMGLTPRQYAAAKRAEATRQELHNAKSVTQAIYGGGFNASSRFYEASSGMLGMAPSSYRTGGAGEKIRFAVRDSSLGPVLVASTENGVCSVSLGADGDVLAQELQRRFPNASLVGGDQAFEETISAVIGLVENPGKECDLPLDIRGSAFQAKVWGALREIPTGQTVSYAEVARRIGEPRSSRAVARACGANHLAVVVPCHRVVRADGALSGYRWGVDRKRELLRREAKALDE